MTAGFNTGTTTTQTAVAHTVQPTLTIPAGVADRDLLIVSVTVFTFTSGAPAITLTPAVGSWTPLGGGLQDSGASGGLNVYGASWQRQATASDAGSVLTFAFTGPVGATDQFWWAVALDAYTGFGGVDAASAAAGLGPNSAPGPTTGVDGAWLVETAAMAISGAGGIGAGPAGASTIRENANTAGVAAAIADSAASVGPAGTSVGGGSWGTSGGSDWWATFTISLAPLLPGGAPATAAATAAAPSPTVAIGAPAAAAGAAASAPAPTAGSQHPAGAAAAAASAAATDALAVTFSAVDGNGVETWNVTCTLNSPASVHALRVLRPSSPAAGRPHNFVYALPVMPELDATFGDGLDVMRVLGVPDAYNVTIVEPTFGGNPWYADCSTDHTLSHEQFMVAIRGWAAAHLAVSGAEAHILIGFSKSGIGGADLLLKHQDLFAKAGLWDFPADMAHYDDFDPNSTGAYGTDANFQASYRLTTGFVSARAAPFLAAGRWWIAGGVLYASQVADFDTLLTGLSVPHAYPGAMGTAHQWDPVWVAPAIAALLPAATPAAGAAAAAALAPAPSVRITVPAGAAAAAGTAPAPLTGTLARPGVAAGAALAPAPAAAVRTSAGLAAAGALAAAPSAAIAASVAIAAASCAAPAPAALVPSSSAIAGAATAAAAAPQPAALAVSPVTYGKATVGTGTAASATVGGR